MPHTWEDLPTEILQIIFSYLSYGKKQIKGF
jgi:hypothetical protein